jgi:hypothetical protein
VTFYDGVPVAHELCGGKVKYSKVGARTVANHRQRGGAGPLRCYECPDCGGWHLARDKIRRRGYGDLSLKGKQK